MLQARGFNYFKAGIFVIVSMFLFFGSIWVMGREREIFSSQKDYFTQFKDVKGLSIGAPVRLGGITIGRVSEITFSPESEVKVTLSLNERYLDRIRLDSRVSLMTQGLLGDRFVSISVGLDPKIAPPGSFIQISTEADITEVMTKASRVVENTEKVTEDLRSITASLSTDAKGELVSAVKELNTLVKDLTDITKQLKSGPGLAHSIIYDKEGGDIVPDFSKVTKSLTDASQDGIPELLKKLNETAENLKQVSQSLKEGSGTLGALMVDSKLYDNLVEVTDGAKRSIILRQAVRASMNN